MLPLAGPARAKEKERASSETASGLTEILVKM